MKIALYHKHFDQEWLEHVKTQMLEMGAPKIKCIWSEIYGMWLAIEGCHRLRAAKDLGITPIIIDITNDETTIQQLDEIDTIVDVATLAQELNDDAWKTEILSFGD